MKYTVVVFILILSCGAAFYFKDEAKQWFSTYISAAKEDPLPTMTVRRRDYRVVVPAQGELAGLKTTPVLTPPIERGSLKVAWLIEEGEVVQPGDVVARFDQTDALLSLERSQNELSSHDHRIQKTERDTEGEMQVLLLDHNAADLEMTYAGNQIRKDEEIFSQWEIQESMMSAALAAFKKETVKRKRELREDLSEADLKILNIDKQKAKMEINLAKETLSSLTVVAPEEGVVIHKRNLLSKLEVGAEVWPEQPLLDIASMNQFRAIVQVPENDFSGVEAGKPVEISMEAFPNRALRGKIQRVAGVAKQIHRNDPRQYFECEVLLDVPIGMMEQMKPGMKLRAEIESARHKSALVLPKSAVIQKETEFIVFIKEDEHYGERKVEILGGDHAFYVVNGIEDGTVVSLGHPFEKLQLHLPDFNGPAATTQGRRFVIF